MSIAKPTETIKAQVRHREDFLKKSLMYLETKINEHINKYPDEEGLHEIKIPMSDYRDFAWFWSDDGGLEELLRKSINDAGWIIETLEPVLEGMASIKVTLKLSASEAELDEFDLMREEATKAFHKEARMRASM